MELSRGTGSVGKVAREMGHQIVSLDIISPDLVKLILGAAEAEP